MYMILYVHVVKEHYLCECRLFPTACGSEQFDVKECNY